MKLQNTIEYFIANGNNVLIRSFGNDAQSAQDWMKNCLPVDKCINLRIVSKTVTFQEVAQHD